MRDRGGEFLLFPATALWWLDYYSVFHTHLRTHYTVVAEASDEYLVYDLRKRRRRAEEGQHADRGTRSLTFETSVLDQRPSRRRRRCQVRA